MLENNGNKIPCTGWWARGQMCSWDSDESQQCLSSGQLGIYQEVYPSYIQRNEKLCSSAVGVVIPITLMTSWVRRDSREFHVRSDPIDSQTQYYIHNGK